jgi:predicted nuclease of restriction endonuclease-like RecB superfamily
MTDFERIYKNRVLESLKEYTIEDQNDFQQAVSETIDNMCTYTSDNKIAIHELKHDVFEDDGLFGRAKNWKDAAYAAIYNNFYENGPSFDEYAANNLIRQ